MHAVLRSTALLTLAFVATGAAQAAPSDSPPMKSADIRRDIIGKRIYLSTPLGGELPLHYATSGTVDGSGDAIGLGKYFKPSDTGRWWINGDQLCQQFKTWYDGKTMCFDLRRVSENKVFWHRNDGETGVARIGQ